MNLNRLFSCVNYINTDNVKNSYKNIINLSHFLCHLKMKQKAEREARDKATDVAFGRYLAEEQKKYVEKQKEDNNARHARSKLIILYSNIYDFEL